MRLKPNWAALEEAHTDFTDVDDHFWEQINEIVQTLEYPYLATKAMERRNFCYTDLYLWSLRISFKLDEIIGNGPMFDFAAVLKANLKEREKSLFKTPIMMAALYLDPRFKARLSAIETNTAIETLQKMYVEIKSKPTPSPAPSLNRIDRLIEAQMFANIQNQQAEASLRAELTMCMSNYNAAQVIDINETAIEFWKENKNMYPQLYLLSNIIFAIASSISETERTFSGFSYIYNNRRMNLNPKNVTNILIIRLNKDLFYEIKRKKLDAIRNS